MRATPLIFLAQLSCVTSALAQTPSFTMIAPPPGYDASVAVGMSGDGRFVAGEGAHVGGTFFDQASFYWSAAGREDFGLAPGAPTSNHPSGISGNGQFVVGTTGTTTRGVYRWSASGGFENPGLLPGYAATVPSQVNGDGSVFVGYATTSVGGSGSDVAFRWTQGGGYQLLAGTAFSHATGVSRDGNVVVGDYGVAPEEAWRWTPQGGTQRLIPTNNPLFAESEARGISGDGHVIVGAGFLPTTEYHPFAWTPEGGMVDLGLPAGAYNAYAQFANFDGSVIVGSMEVANSDAPFVWRTGLGFTSFTDYLTSCGITLPVGYDRFDVSGVSDDGLTFCGTCYDHTGLAVPPRGFVATVPSPSTLIVGASPLLLGLQRRRRVSGSCGTLWHAWG